MDCGQPFTVVVDYAHTDDALRNLTALAREFVSGGAKGRVLTVFGCGGDRDRKKRPLMGEAAGRGSDFVVLTSDNPRSEDPLAIINDALVGLQKTGVKYSVEADRRKAIALAIGRRGRETLCCWRAKGTRRCRSRGRARRPFDDVEVAREALRAAGFECEPAAAEACAGMKLALARIAEFVSAEGGFPPEEVAQGYSIDSRTVWAGRTFLCGEG